MDREEILKRSRASGEDEGVVQAENRGRRIGVYGCHAMCLALVLFNAFNGQQCEEVFAIWFAYLGAENWGEYRLSRTRRKLIAAAAWALLSLGWLAVYIRNVLRGGN